VLPSLVRYLLPSGGQLHARRNAWTAMSQDVSRARVRRDAEAEMQRAVDRAARRGAVAR
jgi:hypothetical protein